MNDDYEPNAGATSAPDASRGSGDRTARPGVRDDVEPSVTELLGRMRAADREAAAIFITRYESRIRRRVRGKLGKSMRRLFDSQDIVSTLGRRLDVYVRDGKVEAQSEDQLWSLVLRIANNAVIDKARVFRRLELVEGEDGELARKLLKRWSEADRQTTDGAEVEIERALRYLHNPDDRQILSMWLVDSPMQEIAEVVGMTSAAVRTRWKRIKLSLHEQLQDPRQA